MKKIFSILCALLMSMTMFAQQSNYAGSSRFFDNWSVTVQGGYCTHLNSFWSGHNAGAPMGLVGLDKYINPWLGLGGDTRLYFGTGCDLHNNHTVVDGINLNTHVKFNLANLLLGYDGHRKFFEPVLYTGLGWNHMICQSLLDQPDHGNYNYMTYRAGLELNFNLGKSRAWALQLNPSFVWNNDNNFKLNRNKGYFDLTGGVVYHFKTSNGTHDFTKAKLYSQAEVDHLNLHINELQGLTRSQQDIIETQKEQIKSIKRDTVYVNVPTEASNKFYFKQGSSDLTGDVSELASSLKESGAVCVITGYASKEGSEKVNTKLAEVRANVLKQALRKAGVDNSKLKVVNGGATDKFSKTSYEPNRVAVAEVEK